MLAAQGKPLRKTASVPNIAHVSLWRSVNLENFQSLTVVYSILITQNNYFCLCTQVMRMDQRLDISFPQKMDPSARADSACELTMQSPNDDLKQRNLSSPLTSTPFGKDKGSLSNGESPVTSPSAYLCKFHSLICIWYCTVLYIETLIGVIVASKICYLCKGTRYINLNPETKKS